MDDKERDKPTRCKIHHEAAHPKMPHAMNFRLMLSNHGNPAKAKQLLKRIPAKQEEVPQ